MPICPFTLAECAQYADYKLKRISRSLRDIFSRIATSATPMRPPPFMSCVNAKIL